MTTRAQSEGLPKKSLSATVILAAGLLCSTAAFAQFSGPNQTNVINGVVIDWGDDYLFNNPSCQLVVTNAGVLTNFRGYMGYVPGASNTSAVVSDNGSLWYNDGNLYVGNSGAGNQLVISNGAEV